MIDCSEFLEIYSDFRDDLLEVERREDMVLHLALCESCARYHRVLHEGIATLLRAPEISPSEDFLDRLDREIVRASREPRPGAPVGVVIALAVAIGAVAWLPTVGAGPEPTLLPPVVAQAPRPQEYLPLVFRPELLPSSSWYDRTADRWVPDYTMHTLLGTREWRGYTQVAQFGR
jgi:hypothetical protein